MSNYGFRGAADDARLASAMSWIEEAPRTDPPLDPSHRFGGTVVEAALGRLADQPVRALIVSANQRGSMAVGNPQSVRALAGDQVEREAMAQAPLPLGTAYRTAAGNLAARGIEAVLHAVVAPAPGHPATIDAVRRATGAALTLADTARLRSVALPPLGSGTSRGQLPFDLVVAEIIEAIVAYLRRNNSRLERIVVVTDFGEDRHLVDRLIRTAAVHHWVPRS